MTTPFPSLPPFITFFQNNSVQSQQGQAPTQGQCSWSTRWLAREDLGPCEEGEAVAAWREGGGSWENDRRPKNPSSAPTCLSVTDKRPCLSLSSKTMSVRPRSVTFTLGLVALWEPQRTLEEDQNRSPASNKPAPAEKHPCLPFCDSHRSRHTILFDPSFL